MPDAAENTPATAEQIEKTKAEGETKPEGEEGADGEEGEVKPKKSKLKLILLITIPLLVVLIGGGIAAYFMLSSNEEHTTEEGAVAGEEGHATKNADEQAKEGEEAATDVRPENTFFHALPEMMVNLNTPNNRVSYLKFQATLEVEDQAAVDKLTKVMPRILDTIQVYVRELTVDDLKSSLGIEKLRQELLKRIALIAKGVKIYDILFPEMLTQ